MAVNNGSRQGKEYVSMLASPDSTVNISQSQSTFQLQKPNLSSQRFSSLSRKRISQQAPVGGAQLFKISTISLIIPAISTNLALQNAPSFSSSEEISLGLAISSKIHGQSPSLASKLWYRRRQWLSSADFRCESEGSNILSIPNMALTWRSMAITKSVWFWCGWQALAAVLWARAWSALKQLTILEPISLLYLISMSDRVMKKLPGYITSAPTCRSSHHKSPRSTSTPTSSEPVISLTTPIITPTNKTTSDIITYFPVRSVPTRPSMSIINMQQAEEEQPLSLQTLNAWRQQLAQLYETDITLRMKYPTEPMKFYQTEEEIDSILNSLQELTQQQIPILVQSGLLIPLLKLLNHPNSDINMQCISLLHDLITEQPSDDQVFEVYYRMCVWLIENGLFESLVSTLQKMNQEESVEEYEVALQILKLIQALVELWEEAVEPLAAQTKILQYLANRILPNYQVSHKVIDDNKFVSSDVLALLLSHSIPAQLKFHKLCGVEILIQSIRPYLSRAPASNDQQEYLSNLLDCLAILMINPAENLAASRQVFHSMKGNEIMLQLVRAKNPFSLPALKVIAGSFTAATPEQETAIIEELIDFGALKYLFAIVMRQGLRGSDVDQQRAIDEAVLSVLYVMVRATSEIYRARVQSKLTQKRFQKLQKLFEIRAQCMQNMGRQSLEELSSQDYLGLLKEGLTVVQLIDRILASLILSTSTVRDKLTVLMQLYGVSCSDMETTLRNLYKFMGEGPQKVRVQRILSDNLVLLREAVSRKK